MRATLNIPDDLLNEVQKISKEKSKTRAIVTAMEA
jgi:metal-responsive CopG/Arc/MetJ family transcriptional regulator